MAMKQYQLFAADGVDGGGISPPLPAASTASNTPVPGVPAPAAPAPAAQPNTNPFNFPTPPAPAAVAPAPVADPKAPGASATPVVPEKYDFKLPDGLTLPDNLKSKFTDIAKGAHLTQEQADKLVELHSSIVMDAIKAQEKQQLDWAQECTKQGLSTPENMQAAKVAVDMFGGGEAMQALINTGAAYNPAVQKMLQNIGYLLKEDNAPDGKAAGKQNVADLLFSNSKY